ncbi:hypothetical protein WJX84_000658 [Apatococcus fuscideae]|uniref:Uncharacterized protein n=1 Tax=Apatococcus fuscideae TaxID=2026836 RepID=A0AAW1TDD5_9CHLO
MAGPQEEAAAVVPADGLLDENLPRSEAALPQLEGLGSAEDSQTSAPPSPAPLALQTAVVGERQTSAAALRYARTFLPPSSHPQSLTWMPLPTGMSGGMLHNRQAMQVLMGPRGGPVHGHGAPVLDPMWPPDCCRLAWTCQASRTRAWRSGEEQAGG